LAWIGDGIRSWTRRCRWPSLIGAARRRLQKTIEAFGAAVTMGYRFPVNDPAAMREMLELGVDGVMTDRPRLLRDVLAGRGVSVPAPPARS
jgi:glycerophosphoryl diester phosphodiesterase